jgi:hypothetical protein
LSRIELGAVVERGADDAAHEVPADVLGASDVELNAALRCPALLGRVLGEAIRDGLIVIVANFATSLLAASWAAILSRLSFGMKLLVQLLAPGLMQGAFDGRQVAAAQVLVDLGQLGLVGIDAVDDVGLLALTLPQQLGQPRDVVGDGHRYRSRHRRMP